MTRTRMFEIRAPSWMQKGREGREKQTGGTDRGDGSLVLLKVRQENRPPCLLPASCLFCLCPFCLLHRTPTSLSEEPLLKPGIPQYSTILLVAHPRSQLPACVL
jgi:hypothetical protein